MKSLKILAFLEAASLTGPAKNLLQFAELARQPAADRDPVELTLATYRRPDSPATDDFLTSAAKAGIPCEIIRENSAMDFRTVASMRALVERFQPDIVQTHAVKSAFLLWLSGVPRRTCWIHWHHGYTQPTRKQHLYNQLDRLSIRHAEQVVTVTNAFAAELERAGVPLSRVEIIRNAIRPDWGNEAKSDTPHSKKTILTVGRLSKEKAQADLIEALALLPAQHPDLPPVRLLLVGEGHERQHLEQLAASRNVDVTFAGQVSDVRPFYRQADLFALSSLSEGSPNVVIEAMAAGNPIVATSVGGVPETVTDGVEALLVPASQPVALCAAIAKVIADPALASRLAEAAQLRVRREYLPEARVSRILELYKRVISS